MMGYETENTYIQQLISEVTEMSKQRFDPDHLPHFDQIARACREQNRITDEIKILELAVQFYENSALDFDERISMLNKFKAKLNARQKEAKVLEVLGW